MSAKPAEQDNSIEEILASIRQIISEDDPKAGAGATPELVAPEPVAAPVAQDNAALDQASQDVFELVDRVVADDDGTDETFSLPVAPPPAIEPAPVQAVPVAVAPPAAPPPPRPSAPINDALFTQAATAATAGAFAKLSETIALERQSALARGGVTLEDIVKELLTPILRQWIDQNAPGIVDRLVREELEKIARQAREG
jgi:hypothetical protein